MQEMKVEVIAGTRELDGLRAEWEACFEESDASPYLRYDWFRLYVEQLGEAADMRIAVARVDGKVGAILPLEKVRVTIGPVTESILQFSGDGFAPSSAGIFAEGVDVGAGVSACLAALRCHDPDWAFMRLAKVPVHSALARYFRRSHMPGSVQIPLPGSWPEYLETLPGSRRYGIRRRVSGLAKSHAVELVRVGLDAEVDGARLRNAIEGALQVSEASWQGEAEEGLAISDPRCRGFFVEASERMAARGALDLSVLYLDGRPVSFLWGLARPPYTSISKLGFDAAYTKLSPGRAHIAMHIEDSIARGLSVIDFGHEFAEQKRQWSSHELPLCELWYFPKGLRSSLYRSWYRVRRGVKPTPPSG